MKKTFNRIIFCLLLITACHKEQQEQAPNPVNPANELTLEALKQWYAGHLQPPEHIQSPSNTAQKNISHTRSILRKHGPDWSLAANVRQDHGNWWVMQLPGSLTYKGVKQGYRKLAFLRDEQGHISAQILDILPDAIYSQRKQGADTKTFTGRVFISNEDGILLRGNIYINGKIAGTIKPGNTATPSNTSSIATTTAGKSSHNSNVRELEACQWVDGSYVTDDGPVIYSEQVCSTYIPSGGGDGISGQGGGDTGNTDYLGGGGGGGGTSSSVPAVSNLPGENSPGVNPKALMNCFGTIPDAGATMTITIYVVQPFPGTSFDIGPNSVGHVAIGLSKSNNRTTITQVVGFYPNATGFSKLHAPSKVADNGGDLSYNESITYQVDASHFSQITNYISNPPATYDLTLFNCTNFVASACQAGGITIPDASGIVGFNGAVFAPEYGLTPAALGSSISDMSGKPNVNTNGGTTPASHGPCN